MVWVKLIFQLGRKELYIFNTLNSLHQLKNIWNSLPPVSLGRFLHVVYSCNPHFELYNGMCHMRICAPRYFLWHSLNSIEVGALSETSTWRYMKHSQRAVDLFTGFNVAAVWKKGSTMWCCVITICTLDNFCMHFLSAEFFKSTNLKNSIRVSDRSDQARNFVGPDLGPNSLQKVINRRHYTTFTIFSMKYLVMCKVYTDVGGIK